MPLHFLQQLFEVKSRYQLLQQNKNPAELHKNTAMTSAQTKEKKRRGARFRFQLTTQQQLQQRQLHAIRKLQM